MSADFSIYINCVGIKKVKEDLKISLSEATTKDRWSLIHEITDFIKNNINESHDNITGFMEKTLERDVWERLKSVFIEELDMRKDKINLEDELNISVHGVTNSFYNNFPNSVTSYGVSRDYIKSRIENDYDDYLTLSVAVEEEFDIEISDEKWEEIEGGRIKDLLDAIVFHLEDKKEI